MNKKAINRYLHIVIFSVVIFLITVLFPLSASAAPLDEILDYEITADTNEDATVTFNYHIEWKVLDDTTEGDLTWVKIGIPNYHCEEITGLSDAIKEIAYYYDNGYYVRIDLDRHYKKDEVVVMDFSLVQDNIYKMKEPDESSTTYEFTPGWFKKIPVDKMVIRWNSDKAESWEPACKEEDGYLVWEYEGLEEGEKHKVSIIYPIDAFAFDKSKKFENSTGISTDPIENLGPVGMIIFGIIGSLVFHTAAKKVREANGYHDSAGFGTGGNKKPSHGVNSRSFTGTGCVSSSCACACACACAGGGRAGCSTKDFYRSEGKCTIL